MRTFPAVSRLLGAFILDNDFGSPGVGLAYVCLSVRLRECLHRTLSTLGSSPRKVTALTIYFSFRYLFNNAVFCVESEILYVACVPDKGSLARDNLPPVVIRTGNRKKMSMECRRYYFPYPDAVFLTP
jgi:hypothetical protein